MEIPRLAKNKACWQNFPDLSMTFEKFYKYLLLFQVFPDFFSKQPFLGFPWPLGTLLIFVTSKLTHQKKSSEPDMKKSQIYKNGMTPHWGRLGFYNKLGPFMSIWDVATIPNKIIWYLWCRHQFRETGLPANIFPN